MTEAEQQQAERERILNQAMEDPAEPEEVAGILLRPLSVLCVQRALKMGNRLVSAPVLAADLLPEHELILEVCQVAWLLSAPRDEVRRIMRAPHDPDGEGDQPWDAPVEEFMETLAKGQLAEISDFLGRRLVDYSMASDWEAVQDMSSGTPDDPHPERHGRADLHNSSSFWPETEPRRSRMRNFFSKFFRSRGRGNITNAP